jgi:MFS superfamily sulfate permease-like transporter
MGAQVGGFCKGLSIAALGMLTGIGLTLALTQYPGVFELRLGIEEGYLKMDGSQICNLAVKSER